MTTCDCEKKKQHSHVYSVACFSLSVNTRREFRCYDGRFGIDGTTTLPDVLQMSRDPARMCVVISKTICLIEGAC